MALIALVMGTNALLWLLVPARAAEVLAMPLLTGPAMSIQMDIGSSFMAGAVFATLALVRRERTWFIATALPVLGAAAYRSSASALHGAPFLADKVGIEIAMGVILIIAARVLGREPL